MKKQISVFVVLMILATTLGSGSASAQTAPKVPSKVPSEEEIEGAKAKCQKRFEGVPLSIARCITRVDMRVLELRQRASEGKNEELERQLAELRRQLGERPAVPAAPAAPERRVTKTSRRSSPDTDVGGRMRVIRTRLATRHHDKGMEVQLPTPGPIQPAPVVVPQPTPMPLPPPNGAPYMIVPVPGQMNGYTWDPSPQMPRLWVQYLGNATSNWLPGAPEVRVVFKKNGVIIPILHQGDVPYNKFWGDLNRDGRPENEPYRGVDPSQVDQVFIQAVTPRDVVDMIYLVPSQKHIVRPGAPPETLWVIKKRIRLSRMRADIGDRQYTNANTGLEYSR